VPLVALWAELRVSCNWKAIAEEMYTPALACFITTAAKPQVPRVLAQFQTQRQKLKVIH
jgi:hypothetical protein